MVISMSTDHTTAKPDLLSGKLFESIVKRAADSDKDALNELCDSISRDALFMALMLIGDREDAEDIAQESLVDVCKSIHTLRNPKAFRKWLYTIVTNNKNKFLRERLRREVLSASIEFDEPVEERDEFIPAVYIENAELNDLMKQSISELPERQKEAVVLHYYNDMSQREIAGVMDISISCVYQYLSLGRKKIKRDVEQFLNLEPTTRD